jgi:hypothetical protein
VDLENIQSNDTDQMQAALEHMQELQAKAELKDVYALKSHTKKVMNLIGFEDDEENYLIAMFSGLEDEDQAW